MPEPVALVTVIQLSLLTAVHVQLVPAMTDNEPVVAVCGTETLVGVTLGAHCASAARTSSVRAIATMIQKVRVFILSASSRQGHEGMCRSVHTPSLPAWAYFSTS
jgi:hypothetical protein